MSLRGNSEAVAAVYTLSSLSTRANRAPMASITPVSASDGSTEAIKSFVRSTRGFDVAIRSIGCIARIQIHIRAHRRAINSNPTSSNRMFVLIERRNIIDSGSNVPIFPTKERREVIEYRQRQFSTHLPSRSDLQINSPDDKWCICNSNQNKHNTTINKC
jgi:hypothetical protein